jgi:molybdopterin biosynthesis enzyme
LIFKIQDPSSDPELKSGSGSIRDSNKTTLSALVNGEHGFPVVDCGIARDDVHVLLKKLKEALSAGDIVVKELQCSFIGSWFLSRIQRVSCIISAAT